MTAQTILFQNLANSTLAGAISNVATTLTVQAGAGALFPQPAANQYFVLTLKDQTTGLITEIMYVTNVTADTFTIVRAQEGTSAVAWNSGDLCANLFTAGSAASMLQTALGNPGRLLNISYFTAGSYVFSPLPATNQILVQVQGAGGGSGSAPATGAGQFSAGGAGGGGAWAQRLIGGGFSGAAITVGTGGAAGSGGGSGGNGGNSSFGNVIAQGGYRGSTGGPSSTTVGAPSGNGGPQPATGNLNLAGSAGLQTFNLVGEGFDGAGGSGQYGSQSFGAGGTGTTNNPSAGPAVAQAGYGGLVIVTEYS